MENREESSLLFSFGKLVTVKALDICDSHDLCNNVYTKKTVYIL